MQHQRQLHKPCSQRREAQACHSRWASWGVSGRSGGVRGAGGSSVLKWGEFERSHHEVAL
eukprot:scaffold47572_cov18-Tisochrysis_lutea.AAC.1